MNWFKFLRGTSSGNYILQQKPFLEQIQRAGAMVKQADAVLIGAGAGLSTAAGLAYQGPRFTERFGEFIKRYGPEAMRDMYSAGFYPFPTQEERWGYWSKHAYVNRIEPEALPLYRKLWELVGEKEHFVLTTNVDHQFWKAGFRDENIFATQGDYGRIQCARGCHHRTYDAVTLFTQMNEARSDCAIPSYMVPRCPVCGGPMAMNLRCDQFFVEDAHWHQAAERYGRFLESVSGRKVVLLELGVGFNTPGIIRFPFESMMEEHDGWSLIRLNLDAAMVPESFGDRAVGIARDISESLTALCSEHTPAEKEKQG